MPTARQRRSTEVQPRDQELRLMQEKAAALGALKGADVPPMAVSIVLPDGDGVDVNVRISLSTAAAAAPPPMVN